MLFRVRRWIAVMLSLALLPSVGGGAQCASHGTGGGAVVSEQPPFAEASGHQHAGHGSPDRDGQALIHASNAAHSSHTSTQVALQAAPQPASQATAEQAAQDCCPPSSVPGACSSAMGCGVVSAAQSVTGSVAKLAGASVAAAPGSVLPPGPSRAPDVPPPRA